MTKARDLANGGFGLVLVKPSSVVGGTDNGKGTVSFTAQTSVSLNDVFNATYDNYRIIIQQQGTAAGQLRFRYRVSNADNTATNYRQQIVGGDGTLAFAARDIGLTFHLPGRTMNGVTTLAIFDVINPFPSTLRAQQFGTYNDSTSGNIAVVTIAQQLDVTTSYTGFTILAESGNMTGTISVYGYNE